MVKTAAALKMCFYYKKNYGKVMSLNSIPDRKVEGEDEWIGKWSVLGKTTPMFYRCFSHYIGPDMTIVPEDLCQSLIERCLNPSRYVPYYSDKNIFDKLFPEGTCPRTVLRKMGGFYYNREYAFMKISSDLELEEALLGSRTDQICVKPSVDTGSGVGVAFYARHGRLWYELSTGKLMTLSGLNKTYGGDFIIQERLSQSEELSYFNPTSVNTIRMTLYRSVRNDECAVPSAIMRIGGKDSLIDNAHAGGAFVGIHDDGRLCGKVLDQYGRERTVFNGVDFSGEHRIKDWDSIVTFAKKVGGCIPHMRLLALDIMIDSSGKPRLIEFNCTGYSMWLFQYTLCGAFGKYTDEIIEYCRENKDCSSLFIKI